MSYQTKKLGDVLEKIIGGGTPSKTNSSYWNGDIPWASVKDIKEDIFVLSETKDSITQAGLRNSASNLIPKGTIIISTRMGLGRVVKTEINTAINQDLKALLPKKELNVDYLLLFLRAKSEDIVQKGSGATVSGVRLEHIKEIEIPLPALEVQKKIVAKLESLLAKINEAKKLRVETRACADNLLSAELHKIFEEGKKKGWEEKEIGEICELNPKKSEIKDKPDDLLVSFVPMAAVDEYSQTVTSFEERKLGEVKKGYTYFRDGDVLFAKITPCMENGKVAIAGNLSNGIGFGTTEFHVLRPKQEVLADWIYSIVRQPQFRDLAREKMTGTAGQKRVPIRFLENYRIPVPPISEQKKIVKRLEKVSQKVDRVKELQNITENEFNVLESSILSKAFSGELVVETSTAPQPILSPIKVVRSKEEWFAIKQAVGAVVEKLARTPFERGEMVIAKYMFFLQEVFGIRFGLHFVKHNFGPYDPDIKRAITASAFNKDRFFKVRGSGERQVYSLGDNSSKLLEGKYSTSRVLKSTRSALGDLFTHTANAKSSDIERLATVCKIIQDTKSTDENVVIAEMRKWKGDRFTDEQVKKSLQFILTKGWDKKLI
jgi:type I restriction enzyme S subunit